MDEASLPTTAKNGRLDRSGWILAARDALKKRGVAGVKVDPLAKELSVTTGSFYWHFKNRGDLLSEVLKDWQGTNTAALEAAIRHHEGDPDAQLGALADEWIGEGTFDPSYDSAIRDWARTSPKVDETVHEEDERRIRIIQQIFREFGYDDLRSLIRARVTYFHQIGYYTLRIRESRTRRKELKAAYMEVLRGTV